MKNFKKVNLLQYLKRVYKRLQKITTTKSASVPEKTVYKEREKSKYASILEKGV